jgi:hypothetical protein
MNTMILRSASRGVVMGRKVVDRDIGSIGNCRVARTVEERLEER